MKRSTASPVCLLPMLLLVSGAATLGAQTISLPPSGDNQKASVSQHIGLVQFTIEYSSPDVTDPQGADRRGKIWGQLVPWGIHDLGFNNAKGPWRAGANENTVFAVSHDVRVEGKPLAAGRYGLHMLAGENEWTIVFSHNSTSWGSFTYDEKEDALRVVVRPEKAPFREWLTYDVFDRQPDRASVALWWEELRVPFTVTVDHPEQVYLSQIRNELRGNPGFNWQNWDASAQYCLQNNTNLEEALRWAENAIAMPFVGQANFTTHSTKALILDKLGRQAEAKTTMTAALDLPGALPTEIHQYGRRLLQNGDAQAALLVWQKNNQRFGDAWPVHVGLARGYSAVGDYKKALKHAEIAVTQAPDPLNKQNLERAVTTLKAGKDMNASG